MRILGLRAATLTATLSTTAMLFCAAPAATAATAATPGAATAWADKAGDGATTYYLGNTAATAAAKAAFPLAGSDLTGVTLTPGKAALTLTLRVNHVDPAATKAGHREYEEFTAYLEDHADARAFTVRPSAGHSVIFYGTVPKVCAASNYTTTPTTVTITVPNGCLAEMSATPSIDIYGATLLYGSKQNAHTPIGEYTDWTQHAAVAIR